MGCGHLRYYEAGIRRGQRGRGEDQSYAGQRDHSSTYIFYEMYGKVSCDFDFSGTEISVGPIEVFDPNKKQDQLA